MDDSLRNKLKSLSPDQIKKLMGAKSATENSAINTNNFAMPRNDLGMYAISKAQERIWFLSQITQESSLYNIPLAVKLPSENIYLKKFNDAVNIIIEQNEILRTTFHEENGNIFQKIHNSLTLNVEYQDVSEFSNSSDSIIVNDIVVEHASKIFNLTELPLFRIKLIKSCDSEHVLIISLHHIISDGWTNALLSRDITSIYLGEEFKKDKDFQYIDFVNWEQNWLNSANYQTQLKYWESQLMDLPLNIRFPKDIFYKTNSYQGKTLFRAIPEIVYENSLDFCKKNNITAFNFFFVCFSILIEKYTQAGDLIIGIPVANRNQHVFQNTYGLFINSLPLRMRIDSNKTFIENINSCAEVISNALRNQEVPFTEIIKSVNPNRNTQENALFNIHFAYQHILNSNNDERFALLPIDFKNSKFDINFWIEIAGKDRKISITFKSNLISETKINRFIDHFFNLVNETIKFPTNQLSKLNIYPENHIPKIEGKIVDSLENTWLEIFQNVCGVYSENIAVVDSESALTYRTVDILSTKMAKLLQENGINSGDVIILDTGRSALFIVSFIACFKCGCTFLPVENDTPSEKLSFIIHDSGAKIIISEKQNLGIKNITKKDFEKFNAIEHFEYPIVETSDIASIIYTSGTTGKPKGVKISHKALINYTKAIAARINDDNVNSYAHVSAISADLGNTSILLALGYGKTLIFPSKDALINPDLLSDFFTKNPVDVLKIVPSHLSALLSSNSDVLPRKVLICGGESLTMDLVRKIREINPKLRIINHYGPTETTIGVVTHEIEENENDNIIPIGTPLDNVIINVLDKDLNPVPIGITGEIYIGGKCLAEGYLNNEPLTNEKFVEIKDYQASKFYKTGDIAFVNDKGELVFLGRNDSQVKVNGVRTELTEIEKIIKSVANTSAVCVFSNTDSNNNIRIYAAIGKSEIKYATELKNKLIPHLPNLLIPTILFVNEIPLTKNGKIDVKKLKELVLSDKNRNDNILPRDTIEIELLRIFEEMFPDNKISIEDSFFSIGGHSLLAISLINKINKQFNSNLSIEILFQYSSVKEIASLLRSKINSKSTDDNLISLFCSNNKKTIIWIHPAGGNVMCYYPIGNELSHSFDVLAFTANTTNKNEMSIESIATNYYNILKVKGIDSNIVLAGWSMGAIIAFKMACLFSDEGKNVSVILADQPSFQTNMQNNLTFENRLVSYLRKVQIFSNNTFSNNFSDSSKLDYSAILKEFKRINLVPEEVEQENFMSFLRILVKHNEILGSFNPDRFDGEVLLLKAIDSSPVVSSTNLHEKDLADLGWGQYCSNLYVEEVPGNHITMMNPENSSFSAKIISKWLKNN